MSATKPPAPVSETADAVFERRLAAVTQAVDSYHTYLLDYLHRLTRQWQDAENLLQDLWRTVLMNFDEDKIGVLPLLRRKAHQLFIDHYRKLKRRGEVLADEIPETPVQGYGFSAITDEGEEALKARFWSEYPGIELTAQQKETLWLHARYGFTYKEIEERTGIAASTVGDWIVLGRKKLSEILNAENVS